MLAISRADGIPVREPDREIRHSSFVRGKLTFHKMEEDAYHTSLYGALSCLLSLFQFSAGIHHGNPLRVAPQLARSPAHLHRIHFTYFSK